RRKSSTFAETTGFDAELGMHVTFTRAASGAARHHDRQPAHVRILSRTTRVQQRRRPCFSELFWTIWSLLLGGGTFGPPPVSPVFLTPVRVDCLAPGTLHSSRTRTTTRSTDNPVERWRR